MNIYDWYKVYNLADFLAEDLVSKEVEVIFETVGLKEIRLTKGYNEISILFDDVFLIPNLNEKNPFEFEDRAAYIDDNDDIWVGIKVEE